MSLANLLSAVAEKNETSKSAPTRVKSIYLVCSGVLGLNEPVTVQHRSLFCVLNERRLRARTPPVFGSISGVSFLKFLQRREREYYFCVPPRSAPRDLDIDVERAGRNFPNWLSEQRTRILKRSRAPSMCQASRRCSVPEGWRALTSLPRDVLTLQLVWERWRVVTLNDRSFYTQMRWAAKNDPL